MPRPGIGGPILVVEDHPLISTALVIALDVRGLDATPVPFQGAEALLTTIDRYRPGLVLLDLDLGDGIQDMGCSGLDLIEPIRSLGWSVLIVTACRDRYIIATAIAGGAIGWVSKAESFERLLDVVVDAAAGREVLSTAAREEHLRLHREFSGRQGKAGDRLARLSARERQVLDRLAAGQSATAVAAEFTVSLTTVRAQIRSILTKLDVRSQLAAVAAANEAARPGPV
jgi:DNA-binding NarL/FixJ family response regulator